VTTLITAAKETTFDVARNDLNEDFVFFIYLREPILYMPAGFFWASSP